MFVTVEDRDGAEHSINLDHVVSAVKTGDCITIQLSGRREDVKLLGSNAMVFSREMKKYKRST